jgi:hypothetical protein
MMIDHDGFLPAVVMMSQIRCHENIHRQYDGTHCKNNAQHRARYNSTERTTFPLSTVNVHKDRPIDSREFWVKIYALTKP